MSTIDQCCRRQLLAAVGTGVAGAVAGCMGTSEPKAASNRMDWPSVGYDRANTRYSPAGRAPVAKPDTVWEVPIEPPFRQPVLANGQVYMPDRTGLRVVEEATSEAVWRYGDRGAGPFTPPTVHDGVVYLGVSRAPESVIALDADTGEQLWSFGGNAVGDVPGTPTLGADGDRLFVGTTNARVYALDAKTGTPRWHRTVFGSVSSTLAVRSPLVVACTRAGNVYAFRERGNGLWRTQLPTGCATPPTVSGQRIVVGCDNSHLYALDPVSGRRKWDTDLEQLYRGGLAVATSSIYAASGRRVATLDNRWGSSRWSIGVERSVSCAPMVVDETLYAGGPGISAFKASGGISILGVTIDARRWSVDVGGHVGPGMAAGNGRLFAPVRSVDGSATLLALEA